MPYDDNEKLKDQVGMIVGLLNSDDDRILKPGKSSIDTVGKKSIANSQGCTRRHANERVRRSGENG